MSTTAGCVRLNGTERSALLLIAQLDGAPCSKAEMAGRIGCCMRSVDRAIKHLRQDGVIESVPTFSEDGGQGANSYKVSSAEALAAALRRASELSD